MTLAALVKILKRTARIGNIDTTTDQITSDIIEFINMRRFAFWSFWMWDYSIEEFSEALAANAEDLTITNSSAVGAIIALWIDGNDNYLKNLTWKRYLQWHKRKDEDTSATTHYIKRGRDSSNNLRFRFWKKSSAAQTIKGVGKKRLTAYVVADIATNTILEFFPEHVHHIIFTGTLADIKGLQGLPEESLALDQKFTRNMEQLVVEEENQADEDPTAPPPDYWIQKARAIGVSAVP